MSTSSTLEVKGHFCSLNTKWIALNVQRLYLEIFPDFIVRFTKFLHNGKMAVWFKCVEAVTNIMNNGQEQKQIHSVSSTEMDRISNLSHKEGAI